MDKFDELMGEGKMEYEPSPDFTDRVMDEIQRGGHMDKNNKKRKNVYAMAGIAASIGVIAIAFFVVSQSSNSSSTKKQNVAINTTPTAPGTAPTTAAQINPDAAALANQIDSALSSTDKELGNDITSNTIDTSKLNDDGV